MGRNTPGRETRRTEPDSPRRGHPKQAVDARSLRRLFEHIEPLTIGIEEEVMLLDPVTSQPLPVGPEVVGAADDRRVKVELPAAQVELATGIHRSVDDALAEMGEVRDVLVRACDDRVRPAAAAVHPTAPPEAEITPGERYAAIAAEHRTIARRQLVGALQVHVAVGGADRTLAVYNALRGHLPELAALAAAAPFHEGRDTGLASVRPLVCTLLPRQGVPPAIASWEAFAAELDWGVRGGLMGEPSRWWWELRPHPGLGTLELRVPDVQPTLAATRGVVTTAHALVSWLAARHDDGEDLPVAPTWRIAENRWAALRDGTHGEQVDLRTGTRRSTRVVLHALLDALEPYAPSGLEEARRLVERSTACELRTAGMDRAAAWVAAAFTAG